MIEFRRLRFKELNEFPIPAADRTARSSAADVTRKVPEQIAPPPLARSSQHRHQIDTISRDPFGRLDSRQRQHRRKPIHAQHGHLRDTSRLDPRSPHHRRHPHPALIQRSLSSSQRSHILPGPSVVRRENDHGPPRRPGRLERRYHAPYIRIHRFHRRRMRRIGHSPAGLILG